eukprot:226150_1
MAISVIDKALGAYYASLGAYGYYDNNNNGKFLLYCEENEYKESDIEEELSNTPSNCLLLAFDKHFPVSPPIDDPNARSSRILRILNHCLRYGKPPSRILLNIMDLTLKSNAETRRKCHALYQEQCPLIYQNENALKRCFSISMQNHSYPFFTYLTDSYLRDKALYRYQNNEDLPTIKWRKISKYLQKIDKKRNEITDVFLSGIESFFRRCCCPWFFGPAQIARIEDSIGDISSYILLSSKFVQTLLMDDASATAFGPFQLDVSIAFRKTKPVALASNDPDFSDDSSADSDSEDESKEFEMDHIGDVERRLSANKLPFYSFQMTRNISETAQVLRHVCTAFNAFKARSHKKEEHYPQRNRFCMFIDRRKKNKPDTVTIFDPPQSCCNIPRRHVPEWYFNASKTCIIPGESTHDKQGTITSDSQVFGQLMTVSFRVEASDNVKVYLYWMGRYMRIYPHDLPHMFANIFDMTCSDNAQWNANQQNGVFQQMKFPDPGFEAFYNQVSYT